jgi:hypothetical protein
MSDSWIVSVGGKAYGPYTPGQMQAFAAEGRIAPQSLVARPGDTQFKPAADEPDIAQWFASPQAPSRAVAEPLQKDETRAPSFGRGDGTDGELAHYVIVADMKSRSITGLEEEIFALGPAYPIMPQAWVLACEQSANAIRNILMQKLGKLDVLFVIDATHDKVAWHNFAPEAEIRLRRVWTKPQPQPTGRFG